MEIVIEKQKLILAEILGLKARIEVLERQDVSNKYTNDMVVNNLMDQKRIIQHKLNQVEECLNYLNIKLEESRKKETSESRDATNKKSLKICKYNRTGFCRERENCPYFHGLKICDTFSISGVCKDQRCCERHPKRCIYFARGNCQWGSGCKYLHKHPIEIEETDKESLDENEKKSFDQNPVTNGECQGCGIETHTIHCTKCNDQFCKECITMDHTRNKHICLNCEMESDSESDC